MARWNHLVGLGKVPLLCNAHNHNCCFCQYCNSFLQFLPFRPRQSRMSIDQPSPNTFTVYHPDVTSVMNHYCLIKKGEQIMLCRLDLYSHNGTEIEPKNHVLPIGPRKPRESHVHTSFKHFVILVGGQFAARTALGQTVQVLSEDDQLHLHLLLLGNPLAGRFC